MIDFNDPTRSDTDKVLFPDQAAIDKFFIGMDASVLMINALALDDSVEALDVIQRNKDYLVQCLGLETIQDAGVDLAPYQAVVIA
jgi:hypothetical protein